MKATTMKTPKKVSAPRHRGAATHFSVRDWRDIYDALMDAADMHHSGPRADRFAALAQKIRKAGLREGAA